MENNIDACCHCAYCYERMDQPEAAVRALLRSFAYDRPRAEVCCELGRWFFQREQISLASYWYSPCIQLCVCYSRLGDWERAEWMNELAASFKPDAAPVVHNRAYFQSLAAGRTAAEP